ncbi:hypothetical protein DL93DRAFT_572583 [Clavulina sp. PMI_390]|nr:hypothetical protein DL93DRAFT_572583 [Clavulina sp. PMI_390]
MIVDTHSPYIEELDVKTPTSPSDQAASSLVSFRPPTRPPSRLGRTPSSTDPTGGSASSNADFPTLTEILNSPNLLMAALAQMQSQGTLDPLAFPGDPNLDYMNQAGMPNGSSSTTTPSNLAPIPSTSAPNQYPYFPPSASNPATLNPDLTHQLSNPSDPSDPNSALFFPYDNSAALAHQTENLGQTIDAAVGVQNGIERSQIDVNSLMRELLRLDPNAFSIPGDGGGGGATLSELSNGDVDMNGARLEDLGARDDAMMNEIGLPSVDSAITNANANANANTNGVNNVGHNINGTAPNYETFFNSLGDANSRANANNANSYVPPSASGPALSTIEAFDPSQFLTAEAFGTPEPPDHRTSAPLAPAPIPQLFSTSLFADANPLSTTNSGTGYIPPRRTVVPLPTRASTRPKRKSDVAVSYAENDDDEDEDDLDGSADGGPPPSKKTKRKRR